MENIQNAETCDFFPQDIIALCNTMVLSNKFLWVRLLLQLSFALIFNF